VLQVVYFEPPVNSSAIQYLYFPVLSRTLSLNFQDFPGPNYFSEPSRAWKIQEKIQDFLGCVGTRLTRQQRRQRFQLKQTNRKRQRLNIQAASSGGTAPCYIPSADFLEKNGFLVQTITAISDTYIRRNDFMSKITLDYKQAE